MLMMRVKVYRLRDGGKWDDRGTGHVAIDYIEGSKDLGLTVLDEEDNETLLVHNITSDDIYRKQEETIISWRDPEAATELALSFQEAAGCSYIWDNICEIQRNLQFSNLGALEVGPCPASEHLEASRVLHSHDESFRSVNGELRELPPVDLSNLPLILKRDFFPKLLEIFRMCEDLENLDDLHMIFKLVRGIILLNSPSIFDKIFSDEFILDIIGALEYDPEVAKVQKHRIFLKDHVIFKEVRFLHEFCTLSKSLPLVQQLRLFRLYDTGVPEVAVPILCTVCQLYAFSHCHLASDLPEGYLLVRDLSGEGVFEIISDVLQSQDRKIVSAGTDIVILFLNQDPNLLRSYIVQQEGNSLLGLLVKGMVTDFGEQMHCQFLEILRILMDSFTMSGAHRDVIIEIFYERHLDYLVDVIASCCPPRSITRRATNSAAIGRNTEVHLIKPEILLNICELLCFCVVHHPYRIKCNFLMNNAIEKILTMTRRSEKFLVVAAVRFMRTIISRNDEHLVRHVVKFNLLKPIIDAFVENGDRYNMLQSGVLELLEHIRKENLKPLVIYVIESFSDQLMKFEHFGSIQAFKLKYQQYLESAETKLSASVPDIRKKAEGRGLEKEEEDYFNEDSDEEDSVRRTKHAHHEERKADVANGSEADDISSRPKSGGLVDYADDDDEDFNPPPKEPDRPAEDDELLKISRVKRKSVNTGDGKHADGEVRKRQKIETRITCSKISALTSLASKHKDSLALSSPSCEVNGIMGEHATHSDEQQHSTDAAETSRQIGGDCIKAMGNLSSEKAVNTTKTNDSEPYSVR
ncbi:hypothetical protein ACQ4PT_024780 [Festuca glaucescens]